MPAAGSEQLRFLWAFLRHPRAVGSITPSSRVLARAVAAHVPAEATCIAELGAGTGSITRVLLERLGPDALLLAMEIEPAFCAALRAALPDRRLQVIQAPAQELPERAAGFDRPLAAVVSGLPFANFPLSLRHEIVGAAHRALAPGGVFAGYGYAPFALPPVLRAHFGRVDVRFVWQNVPPAFVFSAQKSPA